MATVFLAIGLVGIFFIGMSVRLLLVKNGEFKGTCASQSPFLNKEGVTCNYCGKSVQPGDSCANPESQVNKVLEKFK